MGFAQERPENLFTYTDYLSWPQDERWEIINGVAYNMTPAPSRQHQDISRELMITIGNFLKGKHCKLYSAPFDVLLTSNKNLNNNEITTVVQPDLVVICDSSKLDTRGCIGAPDLVVEILSRESASRDMKTKLSLYEQSGVTEYWIISPFEQIVWVYLLDKNTNRYTRPEIYSDTDTIQSSVLKGLEISINQIISD